MSPISYVAVIGDDVVGIIRGSCKKISNLYVDGKKQKMGVGRALVDKFEKEAKKQNSKEIKIKASLHATIFYQKLGYKKTTGMRRFMGLKVWPMKKKLIN